MKMPHSDPRAQPGVYLKIHNTPGTGTQAQSLAHAKINNS